MMWRRRGDVKRAGISRDQLRVEAAARGCTVQDLIGAHGPVRVGKLVTLALAPPLLRTRRTDQR